MSDATAIKAFPSNGGNAGGEYCYFDTTWDRGKSDETLWSYFASAEEEFTWSHQ